MNHDKEPEIIVNCGKSHTLITVDGKLYGFGYAGGYELGSKVTGNRFLCPTRLALFDDTRVVSCIAANECSFVCTRDRAGRGAVLAFGKNYAGRLGVKGLNIVEPTPVGDDSFCTSIFKIVCGINHTLFLFKWNGRSAVASCGDGEEGQLGHGTSANESQPKRIAFFDDKEVIDAWAGGHHSFILCKCGLYGFGLNNTGQLGLDVSEEDFTAPKSVRIPQRNPHFDGVGIRKIACGRLHTVLWADNNLLFFFGDAGKLGTTRETSSSVPVKCKASIGTILDISSTHDHTLVGTDRGVYCCGVDACGETALFQKSTDDSASNTQLSLTEIPSLAGRKVLSVHAGYEFSVVRCSDGIVAFGRNTNGQLGLGDRHNKRVPQMCIPGPIGATLAKSGVLEKDTPQREVPATKEPPKPAKKSLEDLLRELKDDSSSRSTSGGSVGYTSESPKVEGRRVPSILAELPSTLEGDDDSDDSVEIVPRRRTVKKTAPQGKTSRVQNSSDSDCDGGTSDDEETALDLLLKAQRNTKVVTTLGTNDNTPTAAVSPQQTNNKFKNQAQWASSDPPIATPLSAPITLQRGLLEAAPGGAVGGVKTLNEVIVHSPRQKTAPVPHKPAQPVKPRTLSSQGSPRLTQPFARSKYNLASTAPPSFPNRPAAPPADPRLLQSTPQLVNPVPAIDKLSSSTVGTPKLHMGMLVTSETRKRRVLGPKSLLSYKSVL